MDSGMNSILSPEWLAVQKDQNGAERLGEEKSSQDIVFHIDTITNRCREGWPQHITPMITGLSQENTRLGGFFLTRPNILGKFGSAFINPREKY
jgi:hypothetical protein